MFQWHGRNFAVGVAVLVAGAWWWRKRAEGEDLKMVSRDSVVVIAGARVREGNQGQ